MSFLLNLTASNTILSIPLPSLPALAILVRTLKVLIFLTESAQTCVVVSGLPLIDFDVLCVIRSPPTLVVSVAIVVAGLFGKAVTATFVDLVATGVFGIAHVRLCL